MCRELNSLSHLHLVTYTRAKFCRLHGGEGDYACVHCARLLPPFLQMRRLPGMLKVLSISVCIHSRARGPGTYVLLLAQCVRFTC